MEKWLALAGAKSCNLGESSTALESVTRERIESVSKHFFTEIWGLGEGSRPRGAPSYGYKKRVQARDALVKAFLEQYDIGKAPTGDSGIDIKSRMKVQVHEWWNSSEQAASLRKDNEWGADGTVAVSSCLEDVNHAYLQEGVLLPSTTSRRLRCVQTWMKRQ
jgi:hypothetical protein